MREFADRRRVVRVLSAATLSLVLSTLSGPLRASGAENDGASPEDLARDILQTTGVRGGLIVHLGCGDGKLTAALRTESSQVHGLDADPANVERARAHIRSRSLYGPVSVDHLRGDRLPYIDNLVNLIVAEELGEISPSELLRVLCPRGVAYVLENGKWTRTIKPLPADIDEWTHFLHDSSNNAVSTDTVVGPPRRLQWVGSPRFTRHHDRMSSVSAVVSAGGRVFYIFDEASRVSVLIPPKWSVIARDAFNGTILWKRPISKWHTHLWPLKSGPADLPRRLVASGDRVYVTLSIDGPLTALDAATGETVRTYEGSRATEEIILSDGVLFLLVNDRPGESDTLRNLRRGNRAKLWDEAQRKITAVRPESGDVLWTATDRALPSTLSATGEGVYFHDGESVVCLDRETGDRRWRSEPVARADAILMFYTPTLVVYDDVVLFSGGETAGKQTGSWYRGGKDTMTALSAKTGKVLWSADHPPSGYRSAEDLLVVNDLVWTGETTSGRAEGVFTGRDPRTGEVKVEFPPDVDTYWFHHRCYRGKATSKYLLMSRTGTEFVDVREKKWSINHWFRGACLYGVMPANGLIYAPPHPCACYLEAKLYGFNALTSLPRARRSSVPAADDSRLEKGPAFGANIEETATADEWPTYRHDAARTGGSSTPVSAEVERLWQADVGGRLTSPVIAAGKAFVASIDTHTVYALDAASGATRWHFTAGGRVDSPPTILQGRVFFGSTDGSVYALRASDGALAWRFRAAPHDERLMSFEQLESVWPVHGSVLIESGVLYCVAGRSMFLDGGLRLYRLDPETGELLTENALADRDPSGKDIQEYTSWLNMPTTLPDVLSSAGGKIYMRSQPFELDGTRVPLKKFPRRADPDQGAPDPIQDPKLAHLFCPTGFLDDSWWHRSYWLYGSMYVGGWQGYYRAGTAAPAGRILVFDDSRVYGFGRKPQFYRWTVPIEHHLFAAERISPDAGDNPEESAKESLVRIPNSASLDPAGKPLTVAAWVRTAQPNGAVFAHGGNVHGYALHLKGGRPQFSVRIDQKLFTVSARTRVVGRWAHVAGVLTPTKELQLFVNGKLAASTSVPGLMVKKPAEGIEIGADDNTAVGSYASPLGFAGLIDEVRVYHRALSAAEIENHASPDGLPDGPGDTKTGNLVLWCRFDAGDATDASGQKNDGVVAGAEPVERKTGRAMSFRGKTRSTGSFRVKHHWTGDLSILARAMVLAGDKIFVAGPPDVIDEPQVFQRIADPKVRSSILEQAASIAGEKGARLLVFSARDGERLADYELENPPVFDGLAAASGRLYMTTTRGRVLCFGGK